MSKTIVSIISEQSIPNYLFIKEMFVPGDKLLFISSKKMCQRITWITDTLHWNMCESEEIVLNNDGDEENWPVMTARIEKALSKKANYCVNLTGGTKFMALAVQSVFEKYNTSFHYIPYPQNTILSMHEGQAKPIEYRATVEEYTHLYNQPLRKAHDPEMPQDYTNSMFNLFLNKFTKGDFEILDKLRCYRERKSIKVSEIETNSGTEKLPQIENLGAFLNRISFPNEGTLSKAQIQYLTGGWFEEYVYFKIKEMLQPNDIVLGAKTSSTNNDLDVVFTLGNKLFVVECKTGVERRGMLNEIVYKASALKENLFGLSAKSFIFSLGSDDEEWSNAAANMGIKYCGRGCFVDPDRFAALMDSINKQAFD